jgi:hypothetical protein
MRRTQLSRKLSLGNMSGWRLQLRLLTDSSSYNTGVYLLRMKSLDGRLLSGSNKALITSITSAGAFVRASSQASQLIASVAGLSSGLAQHYSRLVLLFKQYSILRPRYCWEFLIVCSFLSLYTRFFSPRCWGCRNDCPPCSFP